MNFEPPLLQGTLQRRYQRFFAEVDLNSGGRILAHCPNTGSMQGLVEPGLGVYVSRATNPQRKLAYTLELVDAGTSLVGVNTSRANTLVKEALIQKQVAPFLAYEKITAEVRCGQNSRLDLRLEAAANPQYCCYVEVKSVTLKKDRAALFPDAVTTRGAKHLDELAKVRTQNHRAVMFYLVQREDCKYFTPATHIDPFYSDRLRAVAEQGVEMLAYSCQVSPTGIQVMHPLPVRL